MNALELRGLNKDFGTFKLENINLKLPEGYVLGYIGQNGAGKTTTIKLIMEELKRDSGEIKVFGIPYKGNEVNYKKLIGYIPDECYFPGSFTVRDVANKIMCFYDSFNQEKFKSLVYKWNLPYDKKIKGFSKGMKLKLMFISVISRDTKLLVLDEPTSGLDPIIRDEVLELIQDYISDGKKSVLFSTHIMSDLEKIADYLYFINKGKIVFNNTKDNILEGYLLVKGGNNDLTPELKGKLIGYKQSNIGFEGIINSNEVKRIKEGLLIEKPSIEEIIIFYINGIRR